VSADDLLSVDVRSGVNEQGEGFCTIVATSAAGQMWVGQLPPSTVRRMAMDWIEAAEAAEQDAAVLRCVRHLDLPDDLAGAIVIELRNTRGQPGDDG
jgi:hypothetical protein